MSNTVFGFFGLRENPFKINPDPRFLFLTPEARAVSDELMHGIETRKGLMLLTGEVGTGKTMLLRRLLNWLAEEKMPTALIFNARLTVDNLLNLVLTDFGIRCPATATARTDKLTCLNDWLLARYRSNQIPVLVIDEAQGLSPDVLEEVRLLLNFETTRDKLLQIVLAGQPELNETLKRHELRQLRQRIAIRCQTQPLSLQQTHGYISERLRIAGADGEIFEPEAVRFVHSFSHGTPRVINALCERALFHARAEDSEVVTPGHVEEAARDSQLDRVDSISRSLKSAPDAMSTLDDIESILKGVSRSEATLTAQQDAQTRFADQRTAARLEWLRSRENSRRLPPSRKVPDLPPSSPNAAYRASSQEIAPRTESRINQSTANYREDFAPSPASNPGLAGLPPWAGAVLLWVRGWSTSFSRDLQVLARQIRRSLASARLRYWLPVRRDLRRGFEQLQASAIRFVNDPRWAKWENEVSRNVQAAWLNANAHFQAWQKQFRSSRPAKPSTPTPNQPLDSAHLAHAKHQRTSASSYPPPQKESPARGQAPNQQPL